MSNLITTIAESDLLPEAEKVRGEVVTKLGYYMDADGELFNGIALRLESGKTFEVYLVEAEDGRCSLEWEMVG